MDGRSSKERPIPGWREVCMRGMWAARSLGSFPFPGNLRAFLACLGQADGDGLLAASPYFRPDDFFREPFFFAAMFVSSCAYSLRCGRLGEICHNAAREAAAVVSAALESVSST